jgi:hypothetical protein
MAQTVNLYDVPLELVPDLWPRVVQTLAWRSSDPPPHPAPVLRNKILTGHWHLWVAPDWRFPTRFASVIVGTIEPRPRKKKVLKLYLLAGRHLGTWMDSAARTLSSFASANGCTRLVLIGRRGWMHLRYRLVDDAFPARAVKWKQTDRSAARWQPQSRSPKPAPLLPKTSPAKPAVNSGAESRAPAPVSSGPAEIS